jgi:hypothetical protein
MTARITPRRKYADWGMAWGAKLEAGISVVHFSDSELVDQKWAHAIDGERRVFQVPISEEFFVDRQALSLVKEPRLLP